MKKYKLSLSPDYCSDWAPEDAVRELLANSLDDKSAFQYSYNGDTLSITSLGVQIPASTLLLGNTSKRDDSSTVGMFGEGYKIAMLVLCREGFDVTVMNGDKLWQPVYEYCELFESDALVVNETPLPNNNDLTFCISGVDEELMSIITERCVYLRDDVGETIDTSDGRILIDMEGGLLFVGGIYVQHTDMKYSYDFNPDKMPLNRDRKSVSDWDLANATGRMWRDCAKPEFVAELLYRQTPDVKMLEYSSDSNTAIDNACADLYEEKHNGEYLADNYTESERMKDLGAKNVVVLGVSAFTAAARRSYKYSEPELEEAEEELSPLEMMSEMIDSYGHTCDTVAMSDLVELYEKFEEKGIMWE